MTRFSEANIYQEAREEIAATPEQWKKNNEACPQFANVDSDRLNGVQYLTARVAIGSPNRPVIIQTPAWSDWPDFNGAVRSIGTQRDLTGSTIVYLGFPGMGKPDAREKIRQKSQLTEKQEEDLRAGSFEEVARAQWQAAHIAYAAFTGLRLANQEVHLWGNSMGASGVIGLAQTTPESVKVTGLGLVDNVAFTSGVGRWSGFSRLAMGFMVHGGKDWPYYQKLHPHQFAKEEKTTTGLARAILRQPSGYLLPVHAMSRGLDGVSLRVAAERNPDMRIFLANAERDTLSPTVINKIVADFPSLKGRAEHYVMEKEYHAISSDPIANGILQRLHFGQS